jgi:hypothetical protein
MRWNGGIVCCGVGFGIFDFSGQTSQKIRLYAMMKLLQQNAFDC